MDTTCSHEPHDPPLPTNPPVPPPPDVQLADEEIDVDLAELDELRRDTWPEGVVYLGRWDSLESYFESQLEDLIDPSIAPWLLGCIDWRLVQERFEADGSRFFIEVRFPG
jgi:hypothetical protein